MTLELVAGRYTFVYNDRTKEMKIGDDEYENTYSMEETKVIRLYFRQLEQLEGNTP